MARDQNFHWHRCNNTVASDCRADTTRLASANLSHKSVYARLPVGLLHHYQVNRERRVWRASQPASMPDLELVALVVREYDAAIRFFVDVLQFDLVEDVASLTNDGRPKRWVVVRPRGAVTGILLARADGDQQLAIVGNQFAGRVGFFLRVDDFDSSYARMIAAGVEFLTSPRVEAYGSVVVFRDLEGNRWDLLGPRL